MVAESRPMDKQRNNIAELLLEGRDRSKVALLSSERDYKYGDLIDGAGSVADFLVRSGGLRGDRVLLVLDNSFFWVVAYLGILRAGLVCVPLPPTATSEQLLYVLRDTEARFALLQSRSVGRHASVLHGVHVITDHGASAEQSWPSLETIVSTSPPIMSVAACVDPGDLACLMFTSGSTGKPRGVMISHENIAANTASIVEYLKLTSQDRMMTVLPFHYCFGTSLLHTHLGVGASLVLDHKFLFPEKTLDRMIETGCTGFAGVPSHFQVLLHKTSLRSRHFPNLRYVQQAGGCLHDSFQKELAAALPGTQIFVMYGQTEATARLSYLPPELHLQKVGSIGKGISGVKLAVLSADGTPVIIGQVGEIVAEGKNIALGYWRDPAETERTFRNGRLYTGDRATVDEDGFIFIVGREKDFLKCGGTRVGCKQIEEELMKHPDLLEAAVVGVEDELLGEAVAAFLVFRPGCELQESQFRAFCKERLPFQLVPREIVVQDSLPKNESGKVLKEQLRVKGLSGNSKSVAPPSNKVVVNG